MSKCKECVSEKVCRYNDGINLYCKEDYECPHFKNKADFVEVVYCKECSWSTERTKDNELFQYQCRNTVACGKPRRACDFCSYGERSDT